MTRTLPIAIMLSASFLFSAAGLRGEPLELGAAAPQITAPDHEGKPVDLGAELASGTTLVFFYPRAHTPGCTKQACSLRDSWEELRKRGVKVFGVSSDPADRQASFREKHGLPYALIADTDHKVANAFGKHPGARQAYIFKDGVLVWRDLKAATAKQGEDALAALDNLETP